MGNKALRELKELTNWADKAPVSLTERKVVYKGAEMMLIKALSEITEEYVTQHKEVALKEKQDVEVLYNTLAVYTLQDIIEAKISAVNTDETVQVPPVLVAGILAKEILRKEKNKC